jgi:hypothetical protein
MPMSQTDHHADDVPVGRAVPDGEPARLVVRGNEAAFDRTD